MKEKSKISKFPIKDDVQSKVTCEIFSEVSKEFSLENYMVKEYSKPMNVIFRVDDNIVGLAPLIMDNKTKKVYLCHVDVEPKFNGILNNDDELQDEFANCLNRLAEKLEGILENYGYTFAGPITGKIETENENVNRKI
jgi:hypothetical protein